MERPLARPEEGLPQGWTQGRDVAHLPAHVCLAADQKWCWPGDGEGVAWPFVGACDDALCPHELRSKKAGGWVDCEEWCQNGDTAGFEAESRLVTDRKSTRLN